MRRFRGPRTVPRPQHPGTAHTHNTSVTNIAGVWQLDCGHARGLGDKGARSTFLKVHVALARCRVDIHPAGVNCENYTLTKSTRLD